MFIRIPNNEPHKAGEVSRSLVHNAMEEAKSKGNQLAGIVIRTALSPYPVQSEGPIEATIRIESTEVPFGSLNVIVLPAATA
jgi:hypothetical protein